MNTGFVLDESKNLKSELNELPAELSNCVKIQIELIKKVNMVTNDSDIYLNYLGGKIMIVGFDNKNSGKTDIIIYAENKTICDFFAYHKNDLFKPVFDFIEKKGFLIIFKVQDPPNFCKEWINKMSYILNRYAFLYKESIIVDDSYATMECESFVGCDSLIKKHYSQNNMLTKSQFKNQMTVVQKKILNFLILRCQNTSIDLFKKNAFTVTYKELMTCGCGTKKEQIIKSLEDLMTNTQVSVKTSYGEWVIFNIFEAFRGNIKNGDEKIKVEFSDRMKILINKIGTSKNYTTIPYKMMNTISKYSTMRLYELCCMYRNTDSRYVYIEDDVLRKILNCENKYLDPHNFKRKVLDVAAKDLENLAFAGKVDMYFKILPTEKEDSFSGKNGEKRKKVKEWAFFVLKTFGYKEYFQNHGTKEFQKNLADETIRTLLKNENIEKWKVTEYINFAGSLPYDKEMSLASELQLGLNFTRNDSLRDLEKMFKKYGFIPKPQQLDLFAEDATIE